MIKQLKNNVTCVSVEADKFKSSLISLTFALPLRKETVADNAILAYLLQRSSQLYPDMQSLQRRLAELYGAAVFAGTEKCGDVQLIKLGITQLRDDLSFYSEQISEECARLLCELIFRPRFKGLMFCDEDIEREKRLMLETLDSEYGDKRLYALKQLEALMCAGEPFGLDRLGGREAIAEITGQSAAVAWKAMLDTARVNICLMGQMNRSRIIKIFEDEFSHTDRESVFTPFDAEPVIGGELLTRSEEAELSQAKLVIGLRAPLAESLHERVAYRVMTDVFGGGPYSRLFMNVREKMSLCYYCSARYNRQKGIVVVQSGVENKNIDSATKEIINQLTTIANGEAYESELSASKLALADSLGSVDDSLFSLESWYSSQTCDDEPVTPEEYNDAIQSVTMADIAEKAAALRLSAIYTLTGKAAPEQ